VGIPAATDVASRAAAPSNGEGGVRAAMAMIILFPKKTAVGVMLCRGDACERCGRDKLAVLAADEILRSVEYVW
jgi:hypothetical protein